MNRSEPHPEAVGSIKTVTIVIPILVKLIIINIGTLLDQNLNRFPRFLTKFASAGIFLDIVSVSAGRATLFLTSFDGASVKVVVIDDRIAAGGTRLIIDLQHGTFNASVSRSTTRRQSFGHQMSGGTVIRHVFVRNLLILHRAFTRVTPAFITLFVYHIHHARVGQRFVRAHVLSRLFVKGITIRFFFRFVLQASAVIGRV